MWLSHAFPSVPQGSRNMARLLGRISVDLPQDKGAACGYPGREVQDGSGAEAG